MKRLKIIIGLVSLSLLFNACEKENIQTLPAETINNSLVPTGNYPNAKIDAGGNNVWLDAYYSYYRNEYWAESGNNYASCFAAAVVNVEGQINKTVPTASSVKDKNNSMKGSTKPDLVDKANKRYIYSLSLQNMIDQLKADGFTVENKTTTKRTTARDAIISAIQNDKWVIALAGYMGGGLGHAYPIYALNLTKTNGVIDESKSTIRVFDSWDGSWVSSNNSTQTSLIAKAYTLSTFLDRMQTNTAGTKIYDYYNVITVKK